MLVDGDGVEQDGLPFIAGRGGGSTLLLAAEEAYQDLGGLGKVELESYAIGGGFAIGDADAGEGGEFGCGFGDCGRLVGVDALAGFDGKGLGVGGGDFYADGRERGAVALRLRGSGGFDDREIAAKIRQLLFVGWQAVAPMGPAAGTTEERNATRDAVDAGGLAVGVVREGDEAAVVGQAFFE